MTDNTFHSATGSNEAADFTFGRACQDAWKKTFGGQAKYALAPKTDGARVLSSLDQPVHNLLLYCGAFNPPTVAHRELLTTAKTKTSITFTGAIVEVRDDAWLRRKMENNIKKAENKGDERPQELLFGVDDRIRLWKGALGDENDWCCVVSKQPDNNTFLSNLRAEFEDRGMSINWYIVAGCEYVSIDGDDSTCERWVRNGTNVICSNITRQPTFQPNLDETPVALSWAESGWGSAGLLAGRLETDEPGYEVWRCAIGRPGRRGMIRYIQYSKWPFEEAISSTKIRGVLSRDGREAANEAPVSEIALNPKALAEGTISWNVLKRMEDGSFGYDKAEG